MIILTIILTGVAVALFFIAESIYSGNIKLVKEYYRRNVTRKESYAKQVGISLFILSLALFIASFTSLLIENALLITLIVLAGIIGFVVKFIQVEKRYNGGLL